MAIFLSITPTKHGFIQPQSKYVINSSRFSLTASHENNHRCAIAQTYTTCGPSLKNKLLVRARRSANSLWDYAS